MARVKQFDKKSVRNRVNVANYRKKQKLRAIHEKYVYDQIYSRKDVAIEKTSDAIFGQSLENGFLNINKETETANKLRRWAAHHRITKTALNDLLLILIFAGLNFLPKDSRTFLITPVKVPIDVLSKGKLWYYGVKKCLETVFAQISRDLSIILDFNFDGFPVAKSSNMQFWPILSSIRGMFFM